MSGARQILGDVEAKVCISFVMSLGRHAERLEVTSFAGMEKMVVQCSNCNTQYKGNYCPECGQKSSYDRFTLQGMVGDLFFSAVHVEKKGLLATVLQLTRRPGTSIREYLSGRRNSLYPPFKYLLLIGAIVIVVSLRYKFFHNEITHSADHQLSVIEQWLTLSPDQSANIESFFRFAEDRATLLNVVAIPLFAFFSWAFLSAGRYNFAENLILNTYITAQQLCFILIAAPVLEFFPSSRQWVISGYAFAIIVYNIWVFVSFFQGSKLRRILLSSVAVLTGYVYQFPVNFMVYIIYEELVHHRAGWAGGLF